MYINAHQSWWCNMMCIIFYIMMYGDSESWYIMMCDVHHMWCAVIHIMVKYDSEWCESMYIICDAHHTHIWCVMMYNDVTSFFFHTFFLSSSVPTSFFSATLWQRVRRITTLYFIITRTLLFLSLEHLWLPRTIHYLTFTHHLESWDLRAQVITWHFSIIWTLVTFAHH